MNFKYKARSAEGKIVEGTLSAESQEGAVSVMRQRGLLPIRVERSGSSASSSGSLLDQMKKTGTVPLRDKVIFFRQLATMVGAGVTLGNSLDILAGQTKNLRLAESIQQIKTSVDGGMTFSGAMRTRNEFNTLMVAMIAAGEEGGVLDESVNRLATFLERQDELRRKVISAVTYPAVVIIFAFIILYILVTVVMPRFSQVFKGMKVELPAVTLAVFNFSNWMAEFWYIPIGGFLLFVVLVILMNRNKTTRPLLDRIKLRLPIVGDIIFKSIMARSNRTLSSLVESGVPILRALDMTADVSDNFLVSNGYTALRDAARKGASLGDTAKNLKIFPVMIAHMMKVGEETGRLEEMLAKVADWFETELDEKIKRLTSIIEPLLIVFVGGIVAVVALAIFTPIVTAIQQFM